MTSISETNLHQQQPNSSVRPNPIFGQIINMLYLETGNDLASIIIQDSNNDNMLTTLSIDSKINPEGLTIKVDNLDAFSERLKEAFNYQSFVNIDYKNSRILSLVIATRPVQELVTAKSFEPPVTCHYGRPPC
ncbi:MAG: hypothetical protein ACRC1Z_12285 [Waterburya sp.]